MAVEGVDDVISDDMVFRSGICCEIACVGAGSRRKVGIRRTIDRIVGGGRRSHSSYGFLGGGGALRRHGEDEAFRALLFIRRSCRVSAIE